MKTIFAVLCVAVVAFFLYRTEKRMHPAAISNPVFAEVRVTMDIKDKNIELIQFIKTMDEAECKLLSGRLAAGFNKVVTERGAGKMVRVKSQECKSELPSRYAKIFDNEPFFVPYISGAATEDGLRRELRVVPFGLAQEESDKVCDFLASKLEQGKCVR